MKRLAVFVLAGGAVLALQAFRHGGSEPAPSVASVPPRAATASAPGWLDARVVRAPDGPQAFMVGPPAAAAPFYGRSGHPVDFGGKDAVTDTMCRALNKLEVAKKALAG